MKTIKSTKRALRRFLLETQMLLGSPETEKGTPIDSPQVLQDRVRDTIWRLECVQIDPVNAVRPNQHLVLAARIPGYRPEVLDELLRAGAFSNTWRMPPASFRWRITRSLNRLASGCASACSLSSTSSKRLRTASCKSWARKARCRPKHLNPICEFMAIGTM